MDEFVSAVTYKNAVILYLNRGESNCAEGCVAKISNGFQCIGKGTVKVKYTGFEHKKTPFLVPI